MIMTESEARSRLIEYYGNKATKEDISRFISGAKTYGRQMVVANKQDTHYPNGVIMKVSNFLDKSAEHEFSFIPENFGLDDTIDTTIDYTEDLLQPCDDSNDASVASEPIEVKPEPTAAERQYMEKSQAIKDKKATYWNNILEGFKNRTSNSVGCKKCGMRVSKTDALSYGLVCPRCSNLLVNDTIKSRLKHFDDKLVALGERYGIEISDETSIEMNNDNRVADTGTRLQDLLTN